MQWDAKFDTVDGDPVKFLSAKESSILKLNMRQEYENFNQCTKIHL